MRSLPALTRLRRLRGVAGFVVLGLLCRALIPVGFMPAAIGAGGPIAVCHGGVAGEFFRRLEASQVLADSALAAGHVDHSDQAGHSDHPGHAQDPDLRHDVDAAPADVAATSHEGWEHCPFGAAFGAALLAGNFEPQLLALEHALEIVEPALPATSRFVSSYRARAPPVLVIPS